MRGVAEVGLTRTRDRLRERESREADDRIADVWLSPVVAQARLSTRCFDCAGSHLFLEPRAQAEPFIWMFLLSEPLQDRDYSYEGRY